MSVFHFKRFDVSNERAAMKLGTDSVLLGALAGIPDRVERVLDVGTGTGVVALMLAQRLSIKRVEESFFIDAIDIDGPSIEEASENFSHSPWASCLRAEHCALSHWNGKYDLIVSNPPFFDDSLLNPDSRKSLTRHSISLSYKELCAYASRCLTDNGVLSMILPSDVEKQLMRTAISYSLYPCSVVRVRTTERKPPMRIVVDFGRNRTPDCKISELIMTSSGVFTDQYRSLLDSFLVNL